MDKIMATNKANPRKIAVDILCNMEKNQGYSNILLKNKMDNSIDSRDKGLVTEIVYGVIKNSMYLDYVIEKFSKIKLKKLTLQVKNILKTAIYQLLFLDKIPASAAVNESVKLAKRYTHSAGVNYVNGVLRSVSAFSEKSTIELPKDDKQALSIKYSFPIWLLHLFENEFDSTVALEIIKSMNETPPTIIRVNTIKTTVEKLIELLEKDGVNACVHPMYKNSLICTGKPAVYSHLFRGGYFSVQDTAASLASAVLNPEKTQKVIDVCAAPGGKTTHLSEIMKNTGKIYAFDVYEHKISLIKEASARLELNNIEAILQDATVYDEKYHDFADKILVDAPCSGLGIIGRKPEIKYYRKQDEMDNFPKIQLDILKCAAKYLKHGGEMVYSTCTINSKENIGVVESFLKKNAEFELVPFYDVLENNSNQEKLEYCEDAKKGYMTFLPNIHEVDGFFIAKLKRK